MDKLIKARHYYKFNQDELSAYLDISRSYITMCENNKRTLPDKALKRLNLLNACWYNNQNTVSNLMVSTLLDSLSDHLIHFYKERHTECEQQLKKLRKERNEIADEYETNLNRYRALITLESRISSEDDHFDKQDKSWFQYNTGVIKKEIAKYWKELQMIDYRIKCIEKEIDGLA